MNYLAKIERNVEISKKKQRVHGYACFIDSKETRREYKTNMTIL